MLDEHEDTTSIWPAERLHAEYRADGIEIRSGNRLRPERVPPALHVLMHYAEAWNIGDDYDREAAVDRLCRPCRANLEHVVFSRDDEFDRWLAGPEADKWPLSDEYVAFSILREAADSASIT